MHFITLQRLTIEALSRHRLQPLVAGKDGVHIEKAKPLNGARLPLDAFRIGDRPAEHLVAAAKPENAAATAGMRTDIDIHAARLENPQICNRRLRADQKNEIAVSRDRMLRPRSEEHQ